MELLQANRDKLEIMTEALMKYETIDSDQIDQIMEGKVPDPPSDWDDNSTDGGAKIEDDSGKEASAKKDDGPAIGDTAEQT